MDQVWDDLYEGTSSVLLYITLSCTNLKVSSRISIANVYIYIHTDRQTETGTEREMEREREREREREAD